MTGEKTLASGNVFRWKLEHGIVTSGLQGTFRSTPSPEDLAEIEEWGPTLMPPGARLDQFFVGLGDKGNQAAKAAFENRLGRSSN